MKPLKCNQCTLCCQGDAIRKLPNDNDDLKWVEHDQIPNAFMLDHKPNRDCIYLIDNVGCELHFTELKPEQCQSMDCRNITKLVSKNKAKELGIYPTWKRGKELINRR